MGGIDRIESRLKTNYTQLESNSPESLKGEKGIKKTPDEKDEK